MKRLIAILLGALMLFSLAACSSNTDAPADGGEVSNNEVQQQEEMPEASTKTLAYFQKFVSGGEYTMEVKSIAEGMEVNMVSAFKDGMIYSESDTDGMKNIMVMKDGFQYIIDHAAKTVMKMQVLNDAAVMDMFSEEAAIYEAAEATGTMEYNGKEYFYEEFNVEGEMIKYLFDGDDLRVMKATVMDMESTVEVISLEKGADDALFEIPEDYQTISY